MTNRRTGDRHRGTRVQFWVPEHAGHEVERWRAAAKERGMPLSSWLRLAANRAMVLEKIERETGGLR